MKPYKILIIEDEIIVATDMKAILDDAGYDVFGIATNIKEVDNCVAKMLPDLILCDINLQNDTSGISIISEINKKYSIPFMYVSAYSDMEIVLKAGKTNPAGYITKPFSEKQLIAAVSVFFA